MADKLNLIWVMATGKDGGGKRPLKENQVVLWDKHPDHPEEGEAFIVNDGIPREVAETAEVKRAIADGRLTTEVNWNSKQAKAKKEREAKANGNEEKSTFVINSGTEENLKVVGSTKK